MSDPPQSRFDFSYFANFMCVPKLKMIPRSINTFCYERFAKSSQKHTGRNNTF